MSVTSAIVIDIHLFDFSTACTVNSSKKMSKKTLSTQKVQVLNCIAGGRPLKTDDDYEAAQLT